MVLAIGDTHLKFLYIQSCANAETSPMSLVLHLHLVSATEIVAQCHPRVLGWKDVRTQNEMLDEIHIVPMGHIIGSQRHTQGYNTPIYGDEAERRENLHAYILRLYHSRHSRPGWY